MVQRSMRPASGTATGKVWDTADEISRSTGKRASRAEVLRRMVDAGANPNTASTQYHHWKAEYDRTQTPRSGDLAGLVLSLRDGGRIVLPVEVREKLGVKEGDVLSGAVVDGELRLLPAATALRRAKELVRAFIPEGTELVDGLINERREAARREQS